MTGKELIALILLNDLLDKDVLTAEGLEALGYYSEVEAAANFGVDVSVVRAWCAMDSLKHIRFGDGFLIRKDEKRPIY